MSAFDTLAAMISDLRARVAAQPTYRWGIVTGVNPTRVQHDGPNETPQVIDSRLSPVWVGQRVRVQHLGTSRLVMGVRNPAPQPWATTQEAITIAGNGTIDANSTVGFPAGLFTVPPLVFFSTGNINFNVSWSNLTTAGMTVNIRRMDYATFTGNIPVHWTAIQMTPTSAGG